MESKICSYCKVDKPHSEYFKDNKRKIGIRCRCKDCSKAQTIEWRSKNKSQYNNYVAEWRAKNPDKQHATEIKRNYGLLIEEYNSILTSQDFKCAICKKRHDPCKKKGRLAVDHCHKTKKIRGLLCNQCNASLGNMKDSIEIFKNAIAYLNKG